MSYLKFGDQASIDKSRNARTAIEKMYASFGINGIEHCNDCIHYDGSICRLYNRTHEAYSWNSMNVACGKWEPGPLRFPETPCGG